MVNKEANACDSRDHVRERRGEDFLSNIFGSLISCNSVEKCMPTMCCGPVHDANTDIGCAKVNDQSAHQPRIASNESDRHADAVKISRKVLTYLPSWEREPEPLLGWTKGEQRELVAATRALQKDRAQLFNYYAEEQASWEYLRLLARRLPGKSAEDCRRCLKHVTRHHVAYFGSPSQAASNDSSNDKIRTAPSRSSSDDHVKPSGRRSNSPLRSHRPSADGPPQAKKFTRTATA